MYGWSCSVVAKKLGCQLKIQLRRLKEGAKCLILLVQVPVVLYRAIASQNSSRQSLFFSAGEFHRQPEPIDNIWRVMVSNPSEDLDFFLFSRL